MKEEDAKDWSSRQVRLRAELFLVSVLIFLYAFYGVKIKSGSLVTFEADNIPVFLAFVLWTGLMIMFIVRSQSEIVDMDRGIESVKRIFNESSKLASTLEGRSSSAMLDSLVWELKQQIDNKFDAANDSTMFVDVAGYTSGAQNYLENLKEYNKIVGDIQKERYLAKSSPFPEQPDIALQLEQIENSLIKISNRFPKKEEFDVIFKNSFSDFEERQKEEIEILINISSSARSVLRAVNAERARLRSIGAVMSVERIWISYWIPAGICLLITYVSWLKIYRFPPFV